MLAWLATPESEARNGTCRGLAGAAEAIARSTAADAAADEADDGRCVGFALDGRRLPLLAVTVAMVVGVRASADREEKSQRPVYALAGQHTRNQVMSMRTLTQQKASSRLLVHFAVQWRDPFDERLVMFPTNQTKPWTLQAAVVSGWQPRHR